MKKENLLFFVLVVLITIPKFSYAACAPRVPSLEDRVKNAYAIFTGEVLSVGEFNSKDKRINHKARVKVGKVLKGKINHTADVYFLFVGAEQVNGFDNCVENSYELKASKKDILFYVADYSGKMFTSYEWGTGVADSMRERKEIKRISEMLKSLSQEK